MHTRTISLGNLGFLVLLALLLPLSAAAASSSAAPSAISSVAANLSEPFADVHADSSFFVAIKYLKDNKLIKGYADGTFQPRELITRAEALAMILSLDDEDDAQTGTEVLATKKPFKDVSKKDWFYAVVAEGKMLGVVRGKGKLGRYFHPEDPVNLAEALRMLLKANDIETDTNGADAATTLPTNVPPDAWYANDITYGISRSLLMQQVDARSIDPAKRLTRGEFVLLLYRFLKTQDEARFGYASWYGDGLAKTKLTSGTEYAAKNLTAANRTLPFGTIVRVTNLYNGKQVDVVINDRGPFVTGRIIDLSKTAFSALESPSSGVISVQVEVAKKQ